MTACQANRSCDSPPRMQRDDAINQATQSATCPHYQAIWTAFNRLHGKHPSMVLLHGGSPKGAERIAACWADNR